MKKNKDALLSRSVYSEKIIVEQLLGNFVAEGSKGQELIEDICKIPLKEIKLTDLIQLTIIVSKLTNIHLPRNYKRKKKLIVKWFDDNEIDIKKISFCITCSFESI